MRTLLLIIVAFLLPSKKAISQHIFNQIIQEKIPLDSIYAGKTMEYSFAVQTSWNQIDNNKIVLIYMDKQKNFRIKIFDTKIVCAEPLILSVVICLINLGISMLVGHPLMHGAS